MHAHVANTRGLHLFFSGHVVFPGLLPSVATRSAAELFQLSS